MQKHMKIEDLAIMIKRGFDSTATKAEFQELQKDLQELRKDLLELRKETLEGFRKLLFTVEIYLLT